MRVAVGVGMIVALAAASMVPLAACKGQEARSPAANAEGDPAAGAVSAEADDAGADAAPHEKPFAGSAAEATQLVSQAIDRHREEMGACVNEYKERKKLGRARVEVQVGIDQEGNLLGATLRGKQQDEELARCVQRALADAPFPRSHSGVISVTKVYEEILQ